jgi:adenosylhomocysteine nucleosidase
MKALVMAPMQEELDFLLTHWAEEGYRSSPAVIGVLPVTELPELNLTIARGGVGKAQFAAHTRHILDHCGPVDLVICAGAAGALTDRVAVGDVVVATQTIEHDYGNRFTDRPSPVFPAAPMALAHIRAASAGIRVHYGPIASGDEDVIDTARRDRLYRSTHALAVAWEGAGGARACGLSGVPFVEIRGITDNANPEAPTDFAHNLETALQNVAAVISSMLIQSGATKGTWSSQ